MSRVFVKELVPQTILFSEYFKELIRELFNYCPGTSVV